MTFLVLGALGVVVLLVCGIRQIRSELRVVSMRLKKLEDKK